jgi:hypothetical protein
MSEERGVKDVAKDRLESVGIILNPEKRSGMFLQVDQSTALASPLYEGVEVMSIRDALKKYEWVSDLMWSLVKREQDEYTREADSEDVNGYFIRAMPGAKIEMPVEACLYLKTLGHKQKVHNIIIAEEGSELNIISGCTSHPGVVSGMHIGISEFFVKKDAKISFTMVHGWERDMEIRPRSAAKVEENGVFISNYVLLTPVKLVQMYPKAYLGKNAKAVFSSILLAHEGSVVDVGSYGALQGEKSSVEIISRSISTGGKVFARGHIVAEENDVKGHLECRGLMLSDDGEIHAVPELETKYSQVELSHEAAIGKIAEEQVFYLMCRGMTRDEATSTIVRGFMDVEIKGIPDSLRFAISKAVELAAKDMF